MDVWVVCGLKGGVGKSVLSQSLAVEALKECRRAAIIDTDPQKSTVEWSQDRAAADIVAPIVMAPGVKGVKGALADLQKAGAEVVVIDTPPRATPALNASLEVATSAIMVTRPNKSDLSALTETWDVIQRLPHLAKRAAVVITQAPPGSRAKALGLATDYLKKAEIPTCPTVLTYTLSFPYAQAEGLCVQEREPTSKPRAELAEVYGWLKKNKVI
jgi:chromosome partitioning protein